MLVCNMSNGSSIFSGKGENPNDYIKNILLGLFLGILSLLTVMMNILVLYAVKTERKLHTVGNLYIVSLSVADLIVGATVMPLNIVYLLDDKWSLGRGICQFWLSMDYVASTASIFSLFILCLDRYRSVRQPLKYLRYRTRTRASVMISGAWLLSATWIIPILGWHVFAMGGVRCVDEEQCETEFRCATLFKVLTAVLNFYIPSLLMLWFYAKMFLTVRDHCQQRVLINETFCCSAGGRNVLYNDKRHKTDIAGQIKNINTELPNEVHKNKCTFPMSVNTYSKEVDGDDAMGDVFENNQEKNCQEGPYSFIAPNEMKEVASQIYFKSTDSVQTQNALIENDSSESPDLPVKVKCFPADILQRQPYDTTKRMIASIQDRSFSLQDISGGVVMPKLLNVQSFEAGSCADHSVNNIQESTPWSEDNNQKGGATYNNPFKQSWQRLRFHSKQRIHFSKERKAARQLGCIMAAFMVCWIPYFITFMVIALDKKCPSDKLKSLHMFTIWLGYFNSTLNPFIYPLCNGNFKKTFKAILHINS